MNSQMIYKVLAGFYDLLDVTYFRKYENSPRKVVSERIKDTDRVLDVCTGTATNAMKIAKTKPQTKVVGIDLSKDMLRVAMNKKKQAKLTNMKLYQMDATKLKFKDQCFDKVLISLVLHETEDDLANSILAQAKRVMKEDGELIVTEWERSASLIQRILFYPITKLEPKTYQTFIRKDLKAYFVEHGFRVISEDHCDYSVVFCLKKQ